MSTGHSGSPNEGLAVYFSEDMELELKLEDRKQGWNAIQGQKELELESVWDGSSPVLESRLGAGEW